MREKEYERILEKLLDACCERNHYLAQCSTLMQYLTRIKEQYPYIFYECISQEELERIGLYGKQ